MQKLFAALLTVLLLSACGNDSTGEARPEVPASENGIDAARNFIRAALDGKWDLARTFMIEDSTNVQIIDRYQQRYEQKLDRETKRGYREANIIVYDTQKQGDSVLVVNYSNSFTKERQSLKVIQYSGRWLVDPKSTLIGGTVNSMEQLRDSAIHQRDSLNR